MRIKTAVLSTALASLLLATATFAAAAPAPQGQESHEGQCHGGKEGRMFRRMEHMEHRLDRAVEKGRLTQAQADQFKTEARQLRDEVLAQRQASGGQLSDTQREQFRQRKQALREKVKAALRATEPKGA
jgi:periplasmic protein CpxP/Spy